MQCRGQLSHEVTKKAIKAALKLCMHVLFVIYESHLRTRLITINFRKNMRLIS